MRLDNKQAPGFRLEFVDALVSEVDLPELNRSANKEAVMTVRIIPEMTRPAPAEGSAKPGVYVSTLPKAWNGSDFRLRISGLEKDCAHVTHVDLLKLKQGVKAVPAGASRYSAMEPTKIKYPALVVTLPELPH